MSRQVRGEKPVVYATSATLNIFAPPSLHKLVDVTCDSCGEKGITFDKRLPDGWQHREVRPNVLGGWPRYYDLCPACSDKPDAEIDGRYA